MTDQHRQKISAANKGRKVKKVISNCSHCGIEISGVLSKKFCSKNCSKGARGVTKIRSVEFNRFKKICEICNSPDNLVGDHSHNSGLARGILCRSCNLGIANFRDDIQLLNAAIRYLEK